MTRTSRKPWSTLAVLLVLMGTAGSAAAADVTLAWDPNPAEEGVTGYRLYYGPESREAADFADYAEVVDVGNVTEWQVTVPDTWDEIHFAVVAYSDAGLESDYSDELDGFAVEATCDGGGAVQPAGRVIFEAGSNPVFEFVPDADCLLDDVLVDGVSVGTPLLYELTALDSPHTVQPLFVTRPPNTFTVSASAGSGGTVSPAGQLAAPAGEDLVFEIRADPGFAVADVLVDGVSVGPVAGYTLAAVAGPHTIRVEFMAWDADHDGNQLPDAWEREFLGGDGQDPSADPDGDGVDNLAEYENGTDPLVADLDARYTPVLQAPVSGGLVATATPELSVYEALDATDADLEYEFQLSDEPDLATVLEQGGPAPATVGVAAWTAGSELADGAQYFWRARARDGERASPWTAVATFVVAVDGVPTTATVENTGLAAAELDSTLDVVEPASGAFGVAVEVPAGTLERDFIVTVGTVDGAPDVIQSGGGRVLGRVYELGPHGVPFARPVRVMLPYNQALLDAAEAASPEDLDVVTYNTETLAWEAVPTVAVDFRAQRVVCEVQHFSMYALGVGFSSSEPPDEEPPAAPPARSSGSGGGGGGGCFLGTLGF